MFLRTPGSRFRTPKVVRMGRHVDAKPRLTVVGSALPLAVDAPLRLGSVSRFPWARRATLAAFLTAAVLSLVVAAPISAGALIIRDTVTMTGSETGLVDDCRTGITGTIVGTDVTDILIVDYPPVDFPPTGYHISVTDSGTGQITWSDGTYTLIESVDHISFITTTNGTVVFTDAHEDSGNTYTAAGVFLARTTFHLVSKFTATGGVVRVNFERSHFHFFNGC
jgi:hypothetical protein